MKTKELIEKLNNELQNHFNGNAEFDILRENSSFSYYLKKDNEKFPAYKVQFTNENNILIIDWGSAKQIDPYSFDNGPTGEGISIDGN